MLPTDFVRRDSQVQQIGPAPLGVLAEAREPGIGEHLLLKAIRVSDLESRPGLADEAQRMTRLADEAAAILQIKRHGGHVFLSSQWIGGPSLAEWEERREIGVKLVRDWARQLFEQLAQAHAADVLHRSIGPASIRVEKGKPRLIGFSLNAVAANSTCRAPEIGSDDLADPGQTTRSDVYSLGRVLEELMAEQAAPDRSSPWALLLQACTHPNPDVRPSDAAAVLSAWAGMESELPSASLETADYGGVATEFGVGGGLPRKVGNGQERADLGAVDTVAINARDTRETGSGMDGAQVVGEPTAVETSSVAATAADPRPDPPDLTPTAAEGDSGFVETEMVPADRDRPSRIGLLVAAIVVVVLAGSVLASRAGWLSASSATDADTGSASVSEANELETAEGAPGVSATASEEGSNSPTRDAALSLAQNLVLGNRSTLFSGNDEELAASLRVDLASLDFGEDSRGQEIASSLFGANPLTQDGNPLLNPEAREAWIAEAIRNVGDRDLIAHLTEESGKLREETVTLAEWYEHVAACREVCNLVVLGLLQEHIRRVQTLPHQLLVFEVNDHRIRADLLTELDGFVASQVGSERRFLLIGRASRTGRREYNRELSRRRVDSAEKRLVELGVPTSKIESLWLGYEPPQISDELAARYSVDPALTAEQRNQSVLLVAH